MDLPTCPSCGQSVLDDEPVSCPFCGAAMDGSSGSTAVPKPVPLRNENRPAENSQRQPDQRQQDDVQDDDPFDIAELPQTHRAVACSSRRTKSRPVRVICPMCDTPGFVPRTAAGRQLKCSNPKCLVPVFTAPDPGKTKSKTLPTRISDQAAQQEQQLTRPADNRSSAVLYVILGCVLLVSGMGLKFYLDREPDIDHLSRPIDLPVAPVTVVDGDDVTGVDVDTSPDTDNTPDTQVMTLRLAGQMVRSAQMSVNRDKALCRRMTADAFLRLGDDERARKEFSQLRVVSRQRNLRREYYRIKPMVRSYWAAIRQDDRNAADVVFSKLEPDAATIPKTGMLAVEAAIHWGAVLVQRDRNESAQQLVERLKIDHSIRRRVDELNRSVWSAMMISGAEVGQLSDSPVCTIIWTDPIATAIALELTFQGQWTPALAWATSWDDRNIRTDLLSATARQAIRTKAPAGVIEAVAEASQGDQVGRHRVQAVLAQLSDERLMAAVAEIKPSGKTEAGALPTVGEMLRFRKPNVSTVRSNARTLMELARSAVLRGQTEIATELIVSLSGCLNAALPSTWAVREASGELDRSADLVRTRIRSFLGASESANITPQFNNYRSGLDRLAAAVESRRLFLVQLLCGIVELDGGTSLNLALKQSELLRNELTLDSLCHAIAAEAVGAGGDMPGLTDITSPRVVRGQRTHALAEYPLASAWLATEQSAREGYNKTLFSPFESTRNLPGLRACLQRRITESRANEADLKILTAAVSIQNATCRENSLWTAGVWLARGGYAAEVESWTKTAQLTATDRAFTLSGIIAGLEISKPVSE
ncbi:MAG: hypothetical protein MK110_15380 [Fuerstiella sp.]|nr:hypothetical protein [Fuerstiella sp.]